MRAFLVSISIVVATFATLTLYARAQGVAEGRAQVAELYDAGPVDPVVAADHAIRPVAAPVDPPPAPSKGGTSVLDDALAIAGPLGRLALGGIACLLVARLLSWQRAKRGWLRRGWTGNAAAAGYGALVAFGGVLALGGSIESGLVAVGGATLYGLGLGADPETARKPAVPPPSEEVPT